MLEQIEGLERQVEELCGELLELRSSILLLAFKLDGDASCTLNKQEVLSDILALDSKVNCFVQ